MLIDLPDSTQVHPDMLGILLVINDQFERFPEKFGSPEIRAQLKRDIDDYRRQEGDDQKKPHDSVSIQWSDFHTFFAERLQHYGLTPFADVSFAFLQCFENVRYENALPTLELFGSFYDITDHFCQETARDLVPEKVDYIVTGNVLNDPSCHTKDVFLACGDVLKKDGRAIHLLTLAVPLRAAGEINNTENYTAAGQELLRAVPSKYGTAALIFNQVREVDLASPTINDVPSAISGTSQLHGRVQSSTPQIENDDTGRIV